MTVTIAGSVPSPRNRSSCSTRAVDLADAVAGVVDPLLSPRHPRLDLHAQGAGVPPAVRILPDPRAERRDPLRVDQVLHDQEAVAVEAGHLLVRQPNRRLRHLTHDPKMVGALAGCRRAGSRPALFDPPLTGGRHLLCLPNIQPEKHTS